MSDTREQKKETEKSIKVNDFSSLIDVDSNAVKADLYLFPVSYGNTNNGTGVFSFNTGSGKENTINAALNAYSTVFKFPIIGDVELKNDFSLSLSNIQNGIMDWTTKLGIQAAKGAVKNIGGAVGGLVNKKLGAGGKIAKGAKGVLGVVGGIASDINWDEIRKQQAADSGQALVQGNKKVMSGTQMRQTEINLKLIPKDFDSHKRMISYIKELQFLSLPNFGNFNALYMSYTMSFPHLFLGMVVTRKNNYIIKHFPSSWMSSISTNVSLEQSFYDSDLPQNYGVSMRFEETAEPFKKIAFWINGRGSTSGEQKQVEVITPDPEKFVYINYSALTANGYVWPPRDVSEFNDIINNNNIYRTSEPKQVKNSKDSNSPSWSIAPKYKVETQTVYVNSNNFKYEDAYNSFETIFKKEISIL